MLSRKILAAFVTLAMVAVPMIVSAALIAAFLGWVAGSGPWSWLQWGFLLPVAYLGWLFGFLGLSAVLCRQFCLAFPKPRRLVFGQGVEMDPADVLPLMTVGVCYQGFAVVHALPFARSFGTLLLRAYSPAVHLGPRVRNWGYLYDPDLIELGERALIGGRALIVAHSVTVRPDGASVYVSAPVKVGKRVTIGGDALVSLGCTIGDDAIVETGAVVSAFTHIPAGEIWGGNPAVFRRHRDEIAQPTVAIAPAPAGASVPTPAPSVASGITVDRVRPLVIEALGLRAANAPQELSHETCAAWDSLGQVAIAAAIHDRYGVTIPASEVFRLRTMADVVAAASPRTPAAPSPPATIARSVAAPRTTSAAAPDALPDDPELLPLLDPQDATRALASLPAGTAPAEPVVVTIASTFVTQPLAPTLKVWGRAFGFEIEARFAGYDQVIQTLLGPTEGAGSVVVVLVRPEDLSGESMDLLSARVDQLLDAVEQAAGRLAGARLLVGTLPPVVSAFADATIDVASLRQRYKTRLDGLSGIEVFDFAAVVEGLGVEQSRSSQAEVLTRGPYSAALYQRLAIALIRQIRSRRRSPAKVIALDCDHTLWGGVVGEVGVEGLVLGSDGQGRSFQLFQRYLKRLKERGLLLVVVSKNEDRDVREVFARHPGMILKPEDIVAWRVNWRHKSENLRELADELNLGLDAFVFLDDDPTSRLEVASRIPAVHVVPLPADPSAYCDVLSRLWLFDGAQATSVDVARTRMTQEEQQRRAQRNSAASLDEFLASLELRADLSVADRDDWPRVAQLTQRTNQFNLSLKRRTTEEIESIGAARTVLVVDVADRFGDYGLVGACILDPHPEDGHSEIDTLLMSCRALGRGVEDAFLHGIAMIAAEGGARELVAPFVEGPRNGQVKDFLVRSGFAQTEPNRWTRSIAEPPALPAHVRLRRHGDPHPSTQAGPTPMTDLLAPHRDRCPLLAQAYEALLEQMPSLERSLGSLIARQDEAFWSDGEERCREILHFCDGDTSRFRHAVSAWVEFSMEYLSKQHTFLKTGTYASTDFDQIRHDLYDNDERMRSFYLVALMFSFLFSANYIGYFRFFRAQLLSRLAEARIVCDIGCGHGVYLSQMLLRAPAAAGRGLDISDASLATAASMLAYHRIEPERCAFSHADLRATLPLDSGTIDAATCFEVLEHLDDPRHALEEIHRILRPGAPFCVSAAVRMESVDHLYVFNHPRDVRALLTATGFTVVADDAFPLTGADLQDPAAWQAAVDDPRVSLGYVALVTA
jgi:FkbH-like protein